ncbi:MAG: two component system sensor histidine kinase [Deltaproteobacteria bacterium]|nr:two component system sensor histidine kinase [Deltaproteobacteria bacterium]
MRRPDCVYIHDFEGNFITANSAALRLFGYDHDEILSLNFSALARPDQRSKAFKTFSELMQTGAQKEITELTLMRKDGSYVDVETMGSIIFHEGKPYAIQGVARDITERKKGEEALRKSEEEAKRLAQENKIMAEIGQVVSSSVDIDGVYERFAEEAKKIIQFDRITVSIFNLEEMNYYILFTAGVEVPGFHKGDCHPIRSALLEKAGRMRPGIIFQVSAGKEAQGEEEIGRKLPSFLPLYQAGLHSFMRIPLVSHDEAIGSLNFLSREFEAYSENDLRIAGKIANQIAGAIASALIFAELKRVEAELRTAQLELEAKVQDRTADLVKINKELQVEIIERKHTEELLKKAKEAAEASSAAKSAFLANMSHELRTPLNAIIGFSGLLADEQPGELNETQKEYTQYVLQSGQHLLSLIDDILDLAKVEAGKLQLEVGEVFLPALLQNSFTMIKEKSMKRGIRLQMEIDGIPERIRGEERKLKQVLYNLLSNAVKFTPDGGQVTLEACSIFFRDHQWTKGDGNGEDTPFTPSSSGEWLGISIRDTGIGLKNEDLERIFSPFEQVDNSASRQYQGTGLGLALTRQLVELHKGKIWAESPGKGKGSRFRFLIPA